MQEVVVELNVGHTFLNLAPLEIVILVCVLLVEFLLSRPSQSRHSLDPKATDEIIKGGSSPSRLCMVQSRLLGMII